MRGVEILVVFSVTSFDFPVMPRRVGLDSLRFYSIILQGLLEQCGTIALSFWGKRVGELHAVVRLDALDPERKAPDDMLEKLGGCVSGVLFGSPKDPEAAVFVNESVLEEAAVYFGFVRQAGIGDKFDVNLPLLSRILHLLVWFGRVLRIGQLRSLLSTTPQNPVQARDRARVAALTQFYPEHHQTRVRVPAAHIPDELEFFVRMLRRVVMGTSGAILKGAHAAVVARAPAVDCRAADVVARTRVTHTVFQRIFNNCLPSA